MPALVLHLLHTQTPVRTRTRFACAPILCTNGDVAQTATQRAVPACEGECGAGQQAADATPAIPAGQPHSQAPPVPITAMPGPSSTASHPDALPAPAQGRGVAPPPLHDPGFEAWQAAAAAGAVGGAVGGDSPPSFPLSGMRSWSAAQAAEEAGEAWQDSHEFATSVGHKSARPQTKTERQQMLNKAAQQRCAAVGACLVQRLWPGCRHA